jgi:bifunctional DNA-binding transcriptional regulator/antitoxin component of YhaV-PrlF toxin-antitoxin module
MPKQYINPGPIKFAAIIRRNSGVGNASAYIDFPYDLKATFGVGNLVPFKATFDNRVMYRGSLAKMGGDTAMLLLRKDVRAELGKEPGESVEVIVELDESPRKVIIPEDVKLALETAGLLETFESLAYSHRREHIEAIRDAKKLETRLRRIEKMFEILSGHSTDSR